MQNHENYNHVEETSHRAPGSDLSKELAEQSTDGSLPSTNMHHSTDERTKKILRERGRKLAHPRETESDPDEAGFPVVEFVLGEEHYAIELRYIREVYPLYDLTPVPCTPSFILGIVNVRGQVISVTDIRELFNLPKDDSDKNLSILIVRNQEMELGLIAESVLGERKIPQKKMRSQLPTFNSTYDHYIKGVTNNRVIVLNMDAFLSDSNILVHQEVGD